MARVQIKRIYEPAAPSAALDQWMKSIAPSAELRRWFAHDRERWREFRTRYRAELRQHARELAELRALARKGTLTLLFAARDTEHNEAVVLRDWVAKR